MKEIFVARNEFAATLVSSAVARSVVMYGVPDSSSGVVLSRSCPDDQPVRPESVLDRVALPQELRVPREVRTDAGWR
jgi:hypothetical protein